MLCNGPVSVRLSVRLSLCPVYRPLQQRAAGLLLGAQQAGDIDRLLHGAFTAARGSAANASSVTFTAVVEGWIQTCTELLRQKKNKTHFSRRRSKTNSILSHRLQQAIEQSIK